MTRLNRGKLSPFIDVFKVTICHNVETFQNKFILVETNSLTVKKHQMASNHTVIYAQIYKFEPHGDNMK